jgi:hypothetical protein
MRGTLPTARPPSSYEGFIDRILLIATGDIRVGRRSRVYLRTSSIMPVSSPSRSCFWNPGYLQELSTHFAFNMHQCTCANLLKVQPGNRKASILLLNYEHVLTFCSTDYDEVRESRNRGPPRGTLASYLRTCRATDYTLRTSTSR